MAAAEIAVWQKRWTATDLLALAAEADGSFAGLLHRIARHQSVQCRDEAPEGSSSARQQSGCEPRPMLTAQIITVKIEW